jgi:hypothetical protein
MDEVFRKQCDSSVYSEVEHIKPVRIFLYDNEVKKPEVNDEENVFSYEFEEKYNWLMNWFFKK